MSATPAPELEALVTPEGDLLVPATAVRDLELVPGQRVHLRVVPSKLRNMRGALAGRIAHVSAEQIEEVRRETWDDAELGSG